VSARAATLALVLLVYALPQLEGISMTAPFNLDTRYKAKVQLPDGTIVPVAYNLSTGDVLVKTASGLPWGDDAEVASIVGRGGQYIASSDDFFRGVWEPAPAPVLEADYNSEQRSGGGNSEQRSGGGRRRGREETSEVAS
jgi:hypothetical protein